jgi:hypothetical protein
MVTNMENKHPPFWQYKDHKIKSKSKGFSSPLDYKMKVLLCTSQKQWFIRCPRKLMSHNDHCKRQWSPKISESCPNQLEHALYHPKYNTSQRLLRSFTSIKDKEHLNDSTRLSLKNGFGGSWWNDNLCRLITEDIHEVDFRGKFSREEHFLS